METKELTRWTFEDEILKIPAKCKRLSNKTTRAKIKDIFDKYDFLISYNKATSVEYRDKAKKLQNILSAIKTNKVEYNGGFFITSEISSVSVKDQSVSVVFKNGKEQSFTKDFAWLKDL